MVAEGTEMLEIQYDADDSPSSTRHCYQLSCCVAIHSTDGKGGKPKKYKNATVTLGRNEFREILVRLSFESNYVSYFLKDVKVHYRFAKEGKGSIAIHDRKVQILLSNCPPDKLTVFMKTLDAKLQLMKSKTIPTKATPLSAREKLLSGLPQIFEKLSPLTFVEINNLVNSKLRDGDTKLRDRTNNVTHSQLTPKRSYPFSTKPKQKSPCLTAKIERQISNEQVILSFEQKQVVKAVVAGQNIFFTGSAGTGKSLLLRKIVGLLPSDTTVVTAATGVAACHIGGITLHRFAGIGAGDGPFERCLQMASRPAVATTWKKCTHLILDEISMVDAEFFGKLDKIARCLRRNNQPFGGIQLILCGDFLQLPPVSKEEGIFVPKPKDFCFKSPSWDTCVQKTIVLKEVRRQNDPRFVKILQEIRFGRCSNETAKVLEDSKFHTFDSDDGIEATRLCTHKNDAELINNRQLEELTGQAKRFTASDTETVPDSVDVSCPKEIHLKVGAQILLNKNLDLSKNLSNGSRGIVTGYKNGYPVVRFVSGSVETIKPCRFHLRLPGSNLKFVRTQLPLQLAWAISIHKSQGMSLDRVEMSLSRVFEDGQAYVALSRARSLDGLKIIDFSTSCVRANPEVLAFYRNLAREESIERPFKRQRLMEHFR